METIQHSKIGITNSKHTWECNTTFTHCSYREQHKSTTRLTEAELRGAAATTQEQEEWVQLDNNLKYVLIITTVGAAATLCRQFQHEIGLEIYRQLLLRFKTPIGTRSIGYLTKLLEPTFDTNNFEESFSNWEYEIQQYESDNSTNLPDQVKVAVLMNRTRGPLQQHLHLNAVASPTYAEIRTTITEYQRAHTTFSRLQQNPSSAVSSNYNGGTAPMDIGAISKGKHKGKGKGKHKGKKGKKGNKGKRLRKLRSTPTGKLHLTVNKRKRKDWTRNAF